MRAVIQRARDAKVRIEGDVAGEIAHGIVVLLGIEAADSDEDLSWLIRKITNMRIFDDEDGVMNKSLLETGGEVLAISQFTLHASTKKGNRPSYMKAARPEISEPLYQQFLEAMSVATGKKTQAGKFGADMQVSLINDGPVTILLDTKNKE